MYKQNNKQNIKITDRMDNIQQQLYSLLQAISTNINYPCPLDDLRILMSYEFYFDVCLVIFPQLDIQIIKIQQNQEISSTQKMQKLIEILENLIQIDLSNIRGEDIVKGDSEKIRNFLILLHKFSTQFGRQHSDQREQKRPNTCSQPKSSQKNQSEEQDHAPHSARINRERRYDRDREQNFEVVDDASRKSKKSKKAKSQRKASSSTKEKRNKFEATKNLYRSMVDIIMEQKNRALMASTRDNRKNKNQQVIDAKNKYKAYLINYAKQNKVTENKESTYMKKSQSKRKTSLRELPENQINNINCMFKSFEYKFRDTKHVYLKRIQKLVKMQQIDRMCFLQKYQKDRQQQLKKSTKKQLDRIQNEHRIRTQMLKEDLQQQKQAKSLMKKQYERFLRVQKKQMKENKKLQLTKIKDYMQQQNTKVLQNLEEGGHLQKVILQMYKKF